MTVLEQARAYTEVGAGLAITPNGMSALATIGADSAVREAGHPVRLAGTTDERGAWLMRMPRDPASDGREDVYGIHRQRLHSVLLLAAEAAVFVSGARVVDVAVGAADGQRATVECVGAAGRSRFEADLVVAADGINSAVRRLLAPMTVPLFSGRSSWRGVVQDSSLVSSDFTIRWGPGTEFGAVRIRATRCTGTGTYPRRRVTAGPTRRAPPRATSTTGRTRFAASSTALRRVR
ncbi:hypothetical protein GM708_07110 [Vibrio cholerae]|nr:hypothetical protein [Vibrio cholerae]